MHIVVTSDYIVRMILKNSDLFHGTREGSACALFTKHDFKMVGYWPSFFCFCVEEYEGKVDKNTKKPPRISSHFVQNPSKIKIYYVTKTRYFVPRQS